MIISCIWKINFYILDTTYLSSFICYSTFTTFSSSSTHLLMSLYIIVLEKNFEKKPNLYGNMSKKSCAVALIHEFTSHRYMIMRYETLYLVLSNMRMCWADNWIIVFDKIKTYQRILFGGKKFHNKTWKLNSKANVLLDMNILYFIESFSLQIIIIKLIIMHLKTNKKSDQFIAIHVLVMHQGYTFHFPFGKNVNRYDNCYCFIVLFSNHVWISAGGGVTKLFL